MFKSIFALAAVATKAAVVVTHAAVLKVDTAALVKAAHFEETTLKAVKTNLTTEKERNVFVKTNQYISEK